ncbi:solute carrier family 35 member G1 [Pelobates cultripes]|uniref:Solute carrier family 35 member G1 n=1 Tax=Pelobates cultripes TaxID=61616 RepID=A0AAD1TFW8_PELCU|nr:solute carrier family 35 member G1 [Pelobates cultripes]
MGTDDLGNNEEEEEDPELSDRGARNGIPTLEDMKGTWCDNESHQPADIMEEGDNPFTPDCPQTGDHQERSCCVRLIVTDEQTGKKKCKCPGLGIFYTILSTFFFSSSALLVKKIEGLHSVEISAIRCVFQMLFVLPGLVYYKVGFLGPKDQRIFLFLRGFLGSSAMILLYYAVQSMPLADATVITFSSPAFTCIFACLLLKEKCTVWDIIFILFTITGVVLIARPPFLFGARIEGLEEDYSDHLKGTIAAICSAVGASLTLVVLRKMGKSVHYLLSIWYYAIIGLIECVIALFALGEWRLPSCGLDRFLLICIGLLGLGGQAFLVKALQIEKAGPVSIMRTMDVVFAFIFQALFLNHTPTLLTVGGALCIVASTAGTAILKWYNSSKKAKQSQL